MNYDLYTMASVCFFICYMDYVINYKIMVPAELKINFLTAKIIK
jgi:hypothetical protein